MLHIFQCITDEDIENSKKLLHLFNVLFNLTEVLAIYYGWDTKQLSRKKLLDVT